MTRRPPDRTPAARLVDELARRLCARRAHGAGHAGAAGGAVRRQAARVLGRRPELDLCAGARRRPRSFGATLRAAGIERGDRVALICSNRLEFLRVFLGCAWLGAVAVPINVASRGPQLQHILSNSRRALLIVEGAYRREPRPCSTRAALPLETIWRSRPRRPSRFGNIAATPMPHGGEPVAAAARCGPRDLATILYTSGTTGPSKGVCCPHAQYFWWGVNTARAARRSATTTCSARRLPLFHTNALNTFYQALLTGAAVRLRDALLGVAASGRRWRSSRRDRHLPARRHGADPAVAAGAAPEERAHRVRIALAPGRAGAVPRRVHASAPASGCSTATARPRPTS